MYRFFFYLFLGVQACPVYAQTPDTTRAFEEYREALTLLGQQEFAAALPWLKKAELSYGTADTTVFLMNLYYHTGVAHHALGDYQQATSAYEKALSLRKNPSEPEDPALADLWLGLADSYLQKGDFPAARQAFGQSLQLNQAALGPQAPGTIKTWHGLARLAERDGRIDSALYFLQREFAAIIPSYSGTGLPAVDSTILDEGQLLHALQLYASLQQQSGEAPTAVQSTYQCGTKLMDRILRSDGLLQAQLSLRQVVQPFYEAALDHACRTWENTEDPIWLAWAFSCFEHSRATRLRQAVQLAGGETLPPPNLAYLQASLSQEQGMLLYFTGEDHLYRMLLTARAVKLDRTRPLVPARIAAMRSSIWNDFQPPQLRLGQGAPPPDNPARDLFRLLIGGWEKDLPWQLKIVADEALDYLPFAALQNANGEYLVLNHRLSYAFSAGLWLSQREKTFRGEADFLAFAPGFISNKAVFSDEESYRSGFLGPLLYSRQEVEALARHFDGTILSDSLATKTAFLERAGGQQILHLATHGKVNQQQPGFSFLAFYSPDDSFALQGNTYPHISPLYLSELYAQRIPAGLVVLSACESGMGEVLAGEGIASLAHGFTHAGAQSVLTTLWEVNDEATARFMALFYASLAAGKARDEALRETQLTFIADNEAAVFWAGYRLIGDESPLEKSGFTWWWVLGLLMLVLVLWGFGKAISRT